MLIMIYDDELICFAQELISRVAALFNWAILSVPLINPYLLLATSEWTVYVHSKR